MAGATLTLPFDVAIPPRGEAPARALGARARPVAPSRFDVEPPGGDDAAPGVEAGTPFAVARERGHGGGTLDDVIVGAWEELAAHASVACPVCRGKMVPRYGSETLPVGGRCRRCGTTLG